jgi:magnesium transporter
MDENNELEQNQNYVEEVLEVLRSNLSNEELLDKLSDYHENDIADAFTQLTAEERAILYPILGAERVSEIFSYIENPQEYLMELELEKAAKVIENMDSDDAVDVLEDLDESTQKQLMEKMDDEAAGDIRMIRSYDDDEIGSLMTTNFIEIKNTLTIREAMRELVKQAGENDNISTIYVTDENDEFYGAIDLKDLIIARDYIALEDLISTSYPYVADHAIISEVIERIKDYAEDSIPVLDDKNHLLGIITAQDIVDVVDNELGEDYAKLAGLTAEEDLHEKTIESMKKRMPWLLILLVLSLATASIVGMFEGVVAVLPVVISFQSMILDMSGNVGTQSLAVTIRVLADETLSGSQKMLLVLKETKVGIFNGLILGALALSLIGLYLMVFRGLAPQNAFLISGCVGLSLLIAMMISSLVGTVVPLLFHQIGVDPAAASGPLITTVNDLVAVLTYYGLVTFLLIDICHLDQYI